MGGIYSKISRLRLDGKQEDNNDSFKKIKYTNEEIAEPKTPISIIPKYLLDPRSVTAEIQRTPILIMCEAQKEDGGDQWSSPVGVLPYLETDLDSSVCTIRTSTPILTASPMKDISQTSPVLGRIESFDGSNPELSISQEELDEMLNLDSEEDDEKEQMFNNERNLFESQDQDSEEDDQEVNDEQNNIKDNSCDKDNEIHINPEISLLSEDSHGNYSGTPEIHYDNITSPTAENSLERQFSEIEDWVFSAINQAVDNTGVINKQKNCGAPPFRLDNHLAKTKNGRTPLGIVSSNPCSPMQQVNLIINKNKDTKDNGKTWRDLNEERVNRGLLDVENTPPPSTLPPPDIIQSAPGKLLLANRGRSGNATWARDSSLII